METALTNSHESPAMDALFTEVSTLIQKARMHAAATVSRDEVYAKYLIGRYIVIYEQQGADRARYGGQVLQQLSRRLTEKFGAGWSYINLKNIRQFYTVYAHRITDAGPFGDELAKQCLANSPTRPGDAKHSPFHPETFPGGAGNGTDVSLRGRGFNLSWSHYLILMRIEDPSARNFYEIECTQQQWSVRQLSRQVGSSLYERLALSRSPEQVMRLAREGQTVEKPADLIKDPITLEFLGLRPDVTYTESRLENAIISRMQQFMLELGKGFLFEARQKRFTFDEQHYYIDLVFYNRLLQCYVLIDLKTGRLSHQDLGQMQMYVNYFDRYIKQDFEKPTIGILLCESKNDALVELTLPPDSHIYASAYQLYLPDKALLQNKVREWIEEFNRAQTT